MFNNLKNPLEGLIRARYEAGSLSINPATPHCKVLDFYNYVCIIVYNTDNSLPVLLSSWNYGDKYAKYKSETITLKKSQICLLLQQKYNKTVQVQVTIIPRQPGKEWSVPPKLKNELRLLQKKD